MRTIWRIVGGLVAAAILMRLITRHSSGPTLSVPVFVYGWTADKPFTDITNTFSAGANTGSMTLHASVHVGDIILLVNTRTNEEKQCRVVNVGRDSKTNVLSVSLDWEGSLWTNAGADENESGHARASDRT